MELKSRAADDCSGDHHDGGRESCDQHGHLTPVVKERTGTTVLDAPPAMLDTATDSVAATLSGTLLLSATVRESPPPLVRNSVLRI
jgi:hypothetical protein